MSFPSGSPNWSRLGELAQEVLEAEARLAQKGAKIGKEYVVALVEIAAKLATAVAAEVARLTSAGESFPAGSGTDAGGGASRGMGGPRAFTNPSATGPADKGPRPFTNPSTTGDADKGPRPFTNPSARGAGDADKGPRPFTNPSVTGKGGPRPFTNPSTTEPADGGPRPFTNPSARGGRRAGPRPSTVPIVQAARTDAVTMAGSLSETAEATVSVMNTHSRNRRIVLTVGPIMTRNGRRVPTELTVHPVRVTVPAGQQRTVNLSVGLDPATFKPGRTYRCQVEVSGGDEAIVSVTIEVAAASTTV